MPGPEYMASTIMKFGKQHSSRFSSNWAAWLDSSSAWDAFMVGHADVEAFMAVARSHWYCAADKGEEEEELPPLPAPAAAHGPRTSVHSTTTPKSAPRRMISKATRCLGGGRQDTVSSDVSHVQKTTIFKSEIRTENWKVVPAHSLLPGQRCALECSWCPPMAQFVTT